MREIKFRAWANSKMFQNVNVIDGRPYQNGPGYFEIFSDRELEGGILMQYTELKDKNGKEIYEGDIVYLAGYGNYVVEWPFTQLYKSSWEDDIGGILGSVYETPELLKK